ncbi:MAG: hypothetical protein N3H30_01455 [Candidatus Micrarchaeota archaeon]|nr:hypothetical protein [Candidatus Micrarchaeota archaeon]
MKIYVLALFALVLANALCALDYAVQNEENAYTRWSSTLSPAIVSTAQSGTAICVGDDLSTIYDYSITHNSNIATFCNEYEFEKEYQTRNCLPERYNVIGATGINGPATLGGNEYFDCEITTVQLNSTYMGPSTCKEEPNIAKSTGSAYLLFLSINSQPPPPDNRVTVQYAQSRGGMVCDGAYKLTLDGTQVKSGTLKDINSVQNVKIGKEGTHKLKVDASISRCGAIFVEETKVGKTYIHPFFKLVSGSYPAPVSKEITFTAVSGEVEPEVTGSVSTTGSGILIFPDTLVENQTDSIMLKLKIRNPSKDTEIYVYEIGVSKDLSSKPVQIKSVEVAPDPTLKLLYGEPLGVISPGETKEFNVTVTAFAPIGSSAVGDHRFEITYRYKNYSKAVCGKGFDKGGKITVPFTVIKGDEPANPYDGLGLGVSVNVEPPTVDYNNFEDVNEKGIRVYGTVSLVNTSNNGPVAFCNSKYPCPNVTLEDVEVCRTINSPLPPYAPMYMCTQGCISNMPGKVTTKADGAYDFKGLVLKDDCKVGVNDVADIRATVNVALGPLQTEGNGATPVNTVIPPLECTALNYEMLDIVPGTEKYRFEAQLEHTAPYTNIRYYYDCGAGEGYKSVDDTMFECAYAVEEENDYTRIAGFKVEYEDKAGTAYTTHCPGALVGLCQVYIG